MYNTHLHNFSRPSLSDDVRFLFRGIVFLWDRHSLHCRCAVCSTKRRSSRLGPLLNYTDACCFVSMHDQGLWNKERAFFWELVPREDEGLRCSRSTDSTNSQKEIWIIALETTSEEGMLSRNELAMNALRGRKRVIKEGNPEVHVHER